MRIIVCYILFHLLVPNVFGQDSSSITPIPKTLFANNSKINSEYDSIEQLILKVKKTDLNKAFVQQIANLKAKIQASEKIGTQRKSNYRNSSIMKFVSAEMSNNLTVSPLLLFDSAETIIQNSLQTNFSFSIKNKYSFAGYIQWKKIVMGRLPDYLDFNVSYIGRTPDILNRDFDRNLVSSLFVPSNYFDSLLNAANDQLSKLKSFYRDNQITNKVLKAKETIGNYSVDSSYRFIDSAVVVNANELVKWNSVFLGKIDIVEKICDSIRLAKKQVASFFKNRINAAELIKKVDTKSLQLFKLDSLQKAYNEEKENLHSRANLSRFSFGRVLPYQSNLTLKNNSLRGIDVQYESSKYILSASAGLIDYRMNSLLFKRKLETPLPYAFVLYTAYKPSSKVALGIRYFNGRKDNYASSVLRANVQGVSLEMMYKSNNKLIALEVARNIISKTTAFDTIPKSKGSEFSDPKNMAVSLKSSVYIPSTQTNISANLSQQGKAYNAFNNYMNNTQTRQYDVRFNQNMFHHNLKFSSWIRNSEVTPALNGLVIQSNVTLKSFNLLFHKKRLPLISIGYNPIKQTFVNDSLLQVLIYHALSLYSSYSYKLGERAASVSLVLNKLGNKEASGLSGSSLNNSLNIIFDHTINFSGYTSLLNISYTKSAGFFFITTKGGIVINNVKDASINTGFTVNRFNHSNKIGGYASAQMKIKDRGMLGFDYALSYLPSLKGTKLSEYNYGNIFFRYILIH